MSYKFVNSFDKQEPIINNKTFLQIATFPNSKTKLFHVRKFTINNDNQFIGIKDYYINLCTYNKLLNKRRRNEYKLYAVYDLNTVDVPSLSDIFILKSDILGTDYNYYGSAPF